MMSGQVVAQTAADVVNLSRPSESSGPEAVRLAGRGLGPGRGSRNTVGVRLIRISVPGFAALILLAATGRAPIRLMLPEAGAAPSAGWGIALTQTMEVRMDGGHTMAVERSYSAGFHIEKAAGDGGAVNATVRIDSARAAMVLHDSRQLVDTRRLTGTTFEVRYERTEGAPQYTGSPTIDFGEMMGGAFPIAMLLDNVFLPMPGAAVSAGDSWERVWSRDMILGTGLTRQKITTRFTLERIERQNGRDLARLRFATSDNRLSGVIRIGVGDGIVRDAEIVEVGGGSLEMGGGSYPYTQTTTIRVGFAGRPASRQDGSIPGPAS